MTEGREFPVAVGAEAQIVYPLPINGLDSFLRTHQTLSGPRI
jgi:hypothetical protein